MFIDQIPLDGRVACLLLLNILKFSINYHALIIGKHDMPVRSYYFLILLEFRLNIIITYLYCTG